MYQFAIDYPEICEVSCIGYSVEGRELLMARITDSLSINENEPQFLYTGQMHGDEIVTYILLLRLIDHILTNYGTDTQIANMVNNIEIWINPLSNPDGTYAGGNNTVNGATRSNANGIDLNRNYPDPEDGPHPDGNAWQPETIAFMDLAENNHFVLSANLHSGAEVVNYPWDTWAKRHADDDWWIFVSREYADTVHVYAPSSYLDGFENGITNGWDWYTINGGRQDYMNSFHQCREFTLELSNQKMLPASQLPAHWEYNYRSMLNYIEQCLYGIRGIISDSVTGEPIIAEVLIEGHDIDSSWVYSDLPIGNYHRPIYEGNYSLKYSAQGYFPKTIDNIIVTNKNTTIVDVNLVSGDLIADFSASAINISVGESIDFTDLSYGNIINWDWTFEGGAPGTSTIQNPLNIIYNSPGMYSVTLTVSDGTNSNTITRTAYINVYVEYIMNNSNVTTCMGLFYDSGGASGNYSNYEDFIMTFNPLTTGNKIIANFSFFELEYHSNCNYDRLMIFDGPDIYASLIGTYCGTDSPGTIISSHNTGTLTFQFHSDNFITKPGWIANISCEIPSIILDLKVFLEGPYNGTDMNTTLNPSHLPLNQPYNSVPWNYTGNESVAAIPNSDVVDWVLIELRNTTDASLATGETMIGRQAAFLLNNGSVVGMDGTENTCIFFTTITNNLFVVIWHRNHLGIMSATPLTETSGIYPYDFTTGANQAFGGTLGHKEIGTGVWGMIGGDGDANSQIGNADKNDVWAVQAGTSGYLSGDFTMDVQVNNSDKNDVWAPNSGKGGQVPDNIPQERFKCQVPE